MRRLWLVLGFAACHPGGLPGDSGPESEDTDSAEPFVPDFHVRPGIEQVTVLDATPGALLTLYSPQDKPLLAIRANARGQAHFAYIPDAFQTLDAGEQFNMGSGRVLLAGQGYRITDDTGLTSGPFDVYDVDDIPPDSFYEAQKLTGATMPLLGGASGEALEEGYQYIEVRDGTLLSAMVRFPDATVYGRGPFPTLIDYSGYSPSRPSPQDSESRIANALGYAIVSVNLRGSGCSGGVFDVFNKAEHADGYDIIEVVARQDWVLNGHVGMMGLSYPGIMELYAASTQPPSLAAAVPLSTIADPWEEQWPGGVYNDGFTRQWVSEREKEASAGGSDWVADRIAAGDDLCRQNNELSDLSVDFVSFLKALSFRPDDAVDRDLRELVPKITAPMFYGGQFQDEQTGAEWGSLTDRFTSSPHSRFLLQNGRHPDGYAPDNIFAWFEFLEFYVAQRIPKLNLAVRTLGTSQFSGSFGFDTYRFPDDRFKDYTSYASALAAYEAEAPVKVLFERGYGDPSQPAAPLARFETSLPSWPPPLNLTQPLVWYLDDATLSQTQPTVAAADAWRFDPDAGARTFLRNNRYSTLGLMWNIDWQDFAEGDAVAYLSEPFESATILTGPGIATLWVRSPVDEVEVQVTLTEVRENGEEVFLQNGWLRLGHRAATTGSLLRLERTYAKEDFLPVPVDEWIEADVQIPTFAHPVRAGSRIQLAVSSPGRNHATWTFEAPDYGDEIPIFELGRGPGHTSKVQLRTLGGVSIPLTPPTCESLRGQPCRPWVARVNATLADP